MEITNINQLDLNATYTYADYLLWKFQEKVELIKGKILQMSPAPTPNHQMIATNLSYLMFSYFEKGKCRFFSSPIDVRLMSSKTKEGKTYTVVQPDLCVVCDPLKIDAKGCLGSPDLVVEIIFPGNSKKEMKTKFELYEEAEIPEYWVIHPLERSVMVFVLEGGKYKLSRPIYEDEELISVKFPEIKISVDKIFQRVERYEE